MHKGRKNMLNIDQDKTYHLEKAKIKIMPLLFKNDCFLFKKEIVGQWKEQMEICKSPQGSKMRD